MPRVRLGRVCRPKQQRALVPAWRVEAITFGAVATASLNQMPIPAHDRAAAAARPGWHPCHAARTHRCCPARLAPLPRSTHPPLQRPPTAPVSRLNSLNYDTALSSPHRIASWHEPLPCPSPRRSPPPPHLGCTWRHAMVSTSSAQQSCITESLSCPPITQTSGAPSLPSTSVAEWLARCGAARLGRGAEKVRGGREAEGRMPARPSIVSARLHALLQQHTRPPVLAGDRRGVPAAQRASVCTDARRVRPYRWEGQLRKQRVPCVGVGVVPQQVLVEERPVRSKRRGRS
jgi:hypothetical protein